MWFALCSDAGEKLRYQSRGSPVSLQDTTVRLWNIENMEEIPAVMQKRRTEGTGVHILEVRVLHCKQSLHCLLVHLVFTVRHWDQLEFPYMLLHHDDTASADRNVFVFTVWGVWKVVPRMQTADHRAADAVRLLSPQIALQIPTAASSAHVTSFPRGQRLATEQQLVGIQHILVMIFAF